MCKIHIMKLDKSNLLLSVFILTSIIFSGCLGFDCDLIDEYPDFDNQETMDNATLELLLISNPADIFGEGFDTLEFIVNSDSTYNSWKSIADTTCLACNFPEIDFDTRTLIGKFEYLTCHEGALVKMVKEGNAYKHLIKKEDRTQCIFASCSNYTLAWVTVPKIEETATVVFESGKSYYECDDCF